MKIEIEFNSTIEAQVTVEGRKARFFHDAKKGVWRWEGITGTEFESTVAGLVTGAICDKLMDVLQNWMLDEPNPQNDMWGPWEKLPERLAEDLEDALL